GAVQARVRLTYTKLRRARFIGSLELTTLFHRAARRARLPIACSQGHHPLPRFAFGPALPLGAESWGELVDIDLHEAWDAERVRRALDGQLPDGLQITAAAVIPRRGPSIAARIIAFRYRIGVGSLVEAGDEMAVRRLMAAFLD